MGLFRWLFFKKETPPPPPKGNFFVRMMLAPVRWMLKKVAMLILSAALVLGALYLILMGQIEISLDGGLKITPKEKTPPPNEQPTTPEPPKEKLIYLEFQKGDIVLDNNWSCKEPSNLPDLIHIVKQKYPNSKLVIACRQREDDSARRWQEVEKMLQSQDIKVTKEKVVSSQP